MDWQSILPQKSWATLKLIFKRWERLRILYNLLLLGVVLLAAGPGIALPDFLELLFLIMGAVLANLCFFAGPLTESYLAWLGLKSQLVTLGLFVLGVLISIPLVFLFEFSIALRLG